MTRLLVAALALAVAGCGPGADASAGAGVTLADGSSAVIWGDGDYGLVLVHADDEVAADWAPQAVTFATSGMTVLAPEQSTSAGVVAALGHLREELGVDRVAILASGSGTDAAFAVGRDDPGLVDQLIVISGSGDATALGVFPKLFTAAEGEAAAADATGMTDEAPGDWNALFLAPGTASGRAIFGSEGGEALLDAIQRRLAERR